MMSTTYQPGPPHGSRDGVHYREVITRKPMFLWAVAFLVCGLFVWGFVQQVILGRPFGNNPGPDWLMWVLLISGVGVAAFLYALRLETLVDETHVRVKLHPLWGKAVRLEEIESVTPRRYRPILDYGGWGIRYRPGRGWAYTLSGSQGVEVVTLRGKRVLIGSEHAEELALAILEAAGAEHEGRLASEPVR